MTSDPDSGVGSVIVPTTFFSSVILTTPFLTGLGSPWGTKLSMMTLVGEMNIFARRGWMLHGLMAFCGNMERSRGKFVDTEHCKASIAKLALSPLRRQTFDDLK